MSHIKPLGPVLAALALEAFVCRMAAAFDSSEYRQDTYGPPTRYCDPARPFSSAGAGTLADPWNLIQCRDNPAAGDVVGVLPGIGVPLPTTNNDNIPAFNPANSGTPSQRIVYVAKYAAVALPSVATNPRRTELRHDGTPAVASGDFELGTACPMYGSYFKNYITYDGFFVDMAYAQPKGDSGVIRVDNAVGVHFRNFEIKGTRTNMQSNPVIYRPHTSRGTVLSNFRAYDFSNDTTGSNVPQAALFSDQYGDQDFLIENFEISNTERGIFLKGAPEGVSNYGTIRNGIVRGVSSCYQFNAVDDARVTTLEYSLCYDVHWGGGIVFSAETESSRNLLVHHNTVARVNASSINTEGGIAARRSGFGGNVVMRDNLIDIDSGRYGHGADFGAISTLPAMMDYNGYYKNGANVSWSHNGVQYDSLAAWRSGTGRDQSSLVLSSSPFMDRAAGDFRVAAGHPAKTASSTGGELGAFAGSRVVGVELASSANPGPARPRSLRMN